MIGPIAVGLAAWEGAWWYKRLIDRRDTYERARTHAHAVGKPLLVVGAPDRGPTRSPTGDIVLDIGPSSEPVSVVADVCRRIPLPNDSVVAYVSCVLEYVSDLGAAMRELERVAPGRVYVVRVQPWTLTGMFYPGRRRTLDPNLGRR